MFSSFRSLVEFCENEKWFFILFFLFFLLLSFYLFFFLFLFFLVFFLLFYYFYFILFFNYFFILIIFFSRRKQLLNYFGEKLNVKCNLGCDFCKDPKAAKRNLILGVRSMSENFYQFFLKNYLKFNFFKKRKSKFNNFEDCDDIIEDDEICLSRKGLRRVLSEDTIFSEEDYGFDRSTFQRRKLNEEEGR